MPTKQFTNWEFKLSKRTDSTPSSIPDEWLPSHTQGPTTEIFPDLLHAGLIPDPMKDKNEQLCQWIGYHDWEYRSSLEFESGEDQVDLVMRGLDTFADVYFNDTLVISTDNMFTRYSVSVTPNQGLNTLRIVFHSVLNVEMPYDPADITGGIKSRMFVRKAQYHYGWDWGPTLMTCGLYKPVELCWYRGKLDNVFVDYDVKDVKTGLVEFEVKAETTGEVDDVKFVMKHGDTVVWEGDSSNAKGSIEAQLWFPHTHGTPSLYTLETTVNSITTTTTRVGFRKVELVEDPLAEGTSFFFRVNGIDIYANGVNWIPTSSFFTTLTSKDYGDWLRLIEQANQNMVRIWGGGIYELDWFYEYADKFGIMVWQDFMFACGQYPGDKTFTDSVITEAEQNVQRIRNSPSVVIYAGNNEDYQTVEDEHVPDSEFYARKIYEHHLPSIVKACYGSTTVAYIPGSPWSRDGKSAADLTTGDVHQWNVWHGQELPYQEWSKLAGRFISEFGMQGLPVLETFKEFISDREEMYPQSSTVEMHNKAKGFERKLAMYTYQNVFVKSLQLEDWIYATQLMQSECLSQALLAFRRRWGSSGKRETGGQLVWQINDMYPVTSWAMVDWMKRPKLAYWGVKRSSEQVLLGLTRCVRAVDGTDPGSSQFKIKEKICSVDVWVNNLTVEKLGGVITLDVYNDGEVLKGIKAVEVSTGANSTTECFALSLNDLKFKEGFNPEATIVHAKFEYGGKSSSSSDWPNPLKHFPQSTQLADVSVSGESIALTTEAPLKGVFLEADCVFHFSDNGFDLFPGEKKVVHAPGLGGKPVRVRHHFS